jgi:hypothetical protein
MATSYGFYFVLTVLAVLPAALLLLWLVPRLRGRPTDNLPQESGA